jgi:hypothetical protein
MKNDIQCAKCDRGLEFGGMSGLSMTKAQALQMFADQLGYVKRADGWRCPDHVKS